MNDTVERSRSASLAAALTAVIVLVACGLVISVASGLAWPLPLPVRHGLVAGALVGGVVLAVTWAVASGHRPSPGGIAVALAGLALTLIGSAEGLGTLGVALVVLGAGRAWRTNPDADARRVQWCDATAAAIVLYALFAALRATWLVRTGLEFAASSVSWLASAVTPHDIRLGPTPLGIEAAVLATLIIVAHSARSRAWIRASIAQGLVIASVLAHAIWFSIWSGEQRAFTTEAFEEGPIWFEGLNVLVPTLLVITTLVATARSAARREPTAMPRPWAAALCGLVVFAAVANPRPADTDARRVAVVTRFLPDQPDGEPEPLGYYQREEFDVYTELLARAGLDVRVVTPEEVDGALLDTLDGIVFMNPYAPPLDHAKNLHEFVDGGGGILIVGDHTPVDLELRSLRTFLGPYGIDYEFDSAFLHMMPLRIAGTWETSAVSHAFLHTPEENFGVGGSMQVSGAAEVVLEARWGVGDRGIANGAVTLLGNRHYEHGDRLGNLPVVTRVDSGDGAVVVVGDTGAFSTSAVPFSHEFLLALTNDALRARQVVPTRVRGILALLALGIGGWLAMGRPSWATAAVTIGVVGGVAVTLWADTPLEVEHFHDAVIIDQRERAVTVSLDRDPERSIKGFAHQCHRAGFLPLVVVGDATLPDDAHPAAWVIVAPEAALPAGRLDRIRDYTRDGGSTWLVSGYRESGGLSPLLASLGVGIQPQVLAGIGTQLRADAIDVLVSDASETWFQEAWGLSLPPRAQIVRSVYDVPYVAWLPEGRGGYVVAADSYYLCDRNIETGDSGLRQNISFLRSMLQREFAAAGDPDLSGEAR